MWARPPTGSLSRRAFSCNIQHSMKRVSTLESWDVTVFRSVAFEPALPARLPRLTFAHRPPACQKWFSFDRRVDQELIKEELNHEFWRQHEDITVPIEFTGISTDGRRIFHRSDCPLKLFLDHSISSKPTHADITSAPAPHSVASLYIAQCALSDLPRSLQEDLPIPEIVLKAGRGDIYDASLWMGRAPTYTPLHKDPNPNLFLQLAGQKLVRMFNPEAGRAIFDAVQLKVGGQGNAAMRGAEMMQGRERDELEEAVWGNGNNESGTEARLGVGEAIFIPKGWWHSIRGIGVGMNSSVNFWFR